MKYRALVLSGFLSAGVLLSGGAKSDTKVTTANLNLRSGAGVEYARITTLPRGKLVQVEACRNNWCRISVQGLTGWASSRYLVEPGLVEPFRPTVVVAPPPVKFEPFVPRNYHDLGHSHQHEPNRNFHELLSR